MKKHFLKSVIAGVLSALLFSNTLTAFGGGSEGNLSTVFGALAGTGSSGILATDSNASGWQFTYFGPSTSSKTNTVNPDADIDGEVVLKSATVKSDGTIDKKGGKFVASDPADGISFYYTKIDPSRENFVLQADVKIDYMNPKPDGQEGFALMIRDYIGSKGDSASSESNLVSIGVTQLPKGELNSSTQVKDMLGVRAYTGIDNNIKPNPDLFKVYRMGFDKEGKKAGTGDIYRVKLEKTSAKYIVYQLDMNNMVLHSYEIPIQAKDTNAVSVNSYEELNDPMSVQDPYAYLGFAAARGMNVTFSNISFEKSEFNAADWQPQEPDYIDLKADITSPDTAAEDNYTLVFSANAEGIAKIYQNENLIEEAEIFANKEFIKEYDLSKGNNFKVEFSPNRDYKPEAFIRLSSYEPIVLEKRVSKRILGKDGFIYVSNSGLAENDGSGYDFATNLETALKYAKAGQTILLKPEVYDLSNKTLKVQRGRNGNKDNPIKLQGDRGFATLDFKRSGKGLSIWGNYWELKDFNVTNTADGYKGVQIAGNYNRAERLNLYNNGNTGLQISGSTEETIEKWPSYNYILNCTSMNNADSAMEDADGFAAKITAGTGNVFDGCIAAYNADDGWDLFAKVASGSIGEVTIKNSVAYRNGYILIQEGGDRKNFKFANISVDNKGNINFEEPVIKLDAGNGNGFKMGGSNVPGAHVLNNSIAYENKAKGIDSNSGPNIRISNSTSYNNEGSNIALYTSDKKISTDFRAEGIISFRKGSNIGEQLTLQKQSESDVMGESNYYWDKEAGVSKNTADEIKIVSETDFISLDTAVEPGRNQAGNIDMHGLLILTEEAKQRLGSGAKAVEDNQNTDNKGNNIDNNNGNNADNNNNSNNNGSNNNSNNRGNNTGRRPYSSGGSAKFTAVHKLSNNNWSSENIEGKIYWKYNETGKEFINTWAYLYNPYTGRFAWFRFDERGYMQTGTITENGVSYYLSENSDGSKGEWTGQ